MQSCARLELFEYEDAPCSGYYSLPQRDLLFNRRFRLRPNRPFTNATPTWRKIIEALKQHERSLLVLDWNSRIFSPLRNTYAYYEDAEHKLRRDITTGSLKGFVALRSLTLSKEALLGPDCWWSRKTQGGDGEGCSPPNLHGILPPNLRSLDLFWGSAWDLDQLHDLANSCSTSLPFLQRVRAKVLPSSPANTPDENKAERDRLKASFRAVGVTWVHDLSSREWKDLDYA